MKYLLRYTPEAARDMMDVWDGVYEASKDYDTADKYVDELRELIADKKQFPFSGVMVKYRGLFTGFYAVRYKKYFAFVITLNIYQYQKKIIFWFEMKAFYYYYLHY